MFGSSSTTRIRDLFIRSRRSGNHFLSRSSAPRRRAYPHFRVRVFFQTWEGLAGQGRGWGYLLPHLGKVRSPTAETPSDIGLFFSPPRGASLKTTYRQRAYVLRGHWLGMFPRISKVRVSPEFPLAEIPSLVFIKNIAPQRSARSRPITTTFSIDPQCTQTISINLNPGIRTPRMSERRVGDRFGCSRLCG